MAPAAPGLPTRFPCWCKAVYSWGGETKRDLGFIEGDLIECLNAGDGSWWMGRLKRDRRMVGLFPSNFVELLPEDFQPWSRNASPMTTAGTVRQPVKHTPQKAKTFRKPFTAYASAQAPNPAAAARQIEKAGGIASSPNGSLRVQHKPYSSMKRSSTESRETASPAPSRAPSNLRAVSPRPTSARPRYTRAPEPSAQDRFQDYSRSPSPAPPAQYNPHPRGVSPVPPAQYQPQLRGVSPAPPAQYHRGVSPAPPAQYHRGASPAPPAQYHRAVSPAPPPAQYQRAASPAPPAQYHRAVSPAPPPAQYQRAASPAPPAQYHRAVSPAPPPAQYQRAASPAPPAQYHRAVSPAPPPAQYHAYSRSPSPIPPTQYRPQSRAVSPAPPAQYQPPSRGVSPAPSFQYRAYDRGPSPSPYQDEQFRRMSAISFQEEMSPPPPPPPPHRVAYNPSREPSPAPQQHGYHTPAPPSPDPRAGGKGNFTPSPLTNAMGDVMSALQDMSMSKGGNSSDEDTAPPGIWSPEAFDEVYKTSAKQARTHTSVGISTDSGFHEPDEFEEGVPQVDSYVQRMESRLRRMQQQEAQNADSSGPPPAVPPKNKFHARTESSAGSGEQDVERRGSKTLRHRKSAYEIGKHVLGRTFTTKTNSTTTTHTSASTNRSLMSGHSATNMSSTSAGSYYRKKLGRERPKSVLEASRGAGKGFGFDDGRPESPFSGPSYHSSHATADRPVSSDDQQPIQDGPDPLGGLTAPTKRKSGFFRKMIDTAKTQAANARSTIAAGSISRPGSRAASRAASRAGSRAASRIDGRGSAAMGSGSAVQSNGSRDMGLPGSVDWVQVRRDVNRSNSLSKNERMERVDRCQMMDIPVINPVDILYESAEGDEGLDGLPITEPTDFSTCNLTLVDKSARFINSFPLGTTPAALSQGYVCRPYRSDVQRLRAIFTWVSERIAWEDDFEGEIDTRHVLQSKRGCSHEIAVIVAEMCASVGLHAEVVRGYLKTPGEQLDLESVARPNHFWNAVIVEGEWRIMDCSLAGPTNPKRAQYSNVGASVAETWYFLARPMEVCYSHVPLLPEQQHICPPQPHDVLMALPCATPTFFKHQLQMANFDTSLLNLDNLEMAHIHINVPEDVECVAEVEARSIAQDVDGDYFESGDIVRKPALAQAEWIGGQKRYTVKAVLPGDEGQGVLKVYAGPRGLMHSNKLNPHSLALGLPITHTGTNPPYSFVTLHPTPHAQRHDLYVAQPQCANIALNNTYVFTVRQHASSLTKSPEIASPGLTGRASPNPFARPMSAMSMQSMSATGSNYTNPSQASTSSSSSSSMKPAKLAVQTPSGKIIRLTRKSEHMSGTSDGDGSSWETVIKIGEKGTWRGLVLADRSARWCVFAQWECA